MNSLVILALMSFSGLAFGDAPYPPSPEIASNSVASGYQISHGSPVYTKYHHEPDETISVQSGYEGYLVPAEPQVSFLDVLKTAGIVTLIPPLSKIGIKLGLKFGIWALGFAALFLLGSLVTTTVCAVTPLCTISFIGLGPFNRESVRSIVSDDRLNMATKFVAEAIKKYRSYNKRKSDAGKERR